MEFNLIGWITAFMILKLIIFIITLQNALIREDTRTNRFWYITYDRRSNRGSNQTIVVGFPKLYPTIPMQLGSNVMTVPRRNPVSWIDIYGADRVSMGVFIRVGFRMVGIHRWPWNPQMRDGCTLHALSWKSRLSYRVVILRVSIVFLQCTLK